MQVIKYKILGYTDVWNPETEEVEKKECFCGVSQSYTEANYADAKTKAYNGEVTVEDFPESPAEQIAALKEELESTDYKIIKCSEAQMVGEELPYDIAALHGERQELRDRINELESESRGA